MRATAPGCTHQAQRPRTLIKINPLWNPDKVGAIARTRRPHWGPRNLELFLDPVSVLEGSKICPSSFFSCAGYRHWLTLAVLSGRLGLAVFPIFTLAAVFGPGALAAGRGTISGLARGGMSPEIASCCSTGAVFIFSGSMKAITSSNSAGWLGRVHANPVLSGLHHLNV